MTRATSDGHAGRTARSAARRRLRRLRHARAKHDTRQLRLSDEASPSPAGRPDVTGRSPLQGGGGGQERACGLPSEGAPFFRSYSQTNCSGCPGASTATTRDRTTATPWGTGATGG